MLITIYKYYSPMKSQARLVVDIIEITSYFIYTPPVEDSAQKWALYIQL